MHSSVRHAISRCACPVRVARGEFNLLINPAHARFAEIALVSNDALALDPRLFK
jgi:hypothetical protein